MSDWHQPLPYNTPVLLDTGPILQVIRGNEYGQRINIAFRLSERWNDFYISAISVGELWTLAKRNHWAERKRDQLNDVVQDIRILDRLNPKIVNAYSELATHAAIHGRAIGQNDLWIAALAKTYQMVLVTTDGDFTGLAAQLHELRIIN